ncbi:hypothetical protein J19TS2_17670 [Cohnella xylanilytica]|nr:hypothetical protein J19TS2_17670 [Cohnella xylanilytica]
MLGRGMRRWTSFPWWVDAAAFAGGIAIAAALWFSLHGRSPDTEALKEPGTRAVQEAAKELDAESEPANRESVDKPADREGPALPGAADGAIRTEEAAGASGGGPAAGAKAQREAPGDADDSGLRQEDKAGEADSRPVSASSRWSERTFVRVYLSDKKRVETVPIETYVRGVVAAEMPLDFEPAALEAQALAARTYIVRRLLAGDRTGVPVPGADVTDTQTHQVYRSLEEMARLKLADEGAWKKADDAAKRTAGRVLTYNGSPIEALFFASSNGYTENSEDVFPYGLPYLRSVESPWDREEASNWKETLEFTAQQFYKALGVKPGGILARAGGRIAARVEERTPGRRVKTLKVGSKELTGIEAREKLGLRSAAFDLKLEGRSVVVTTYGNGHGVGLSQWGAEGMAKRGSTAEQIVKHYYTGIRIEEASKLADRLSL